MQRIHVIHVLGDANLSGAPRHVLQLASGLDAKRFAVTVIGPDGPARQEFARYKVKYRINRLPSKFDFGGIGRLRQVIKTAAGKETAVIVHCHGVRAGLFGRLAACGLGYKVVYTEHSWTSDYRLPNPVNNWLQKATLRYLDQYTDMSIGVSQAVVDFLVEARVARATKVSRIYNGIELPAQKQAMSDRPVIGSVGSLTWQKNYNFLINVMALLKQSFPGIRLQIVGAGDQETELRARIAYLGLSDTIELVGSVPHDDLPQHYRKWALYIQPSTNESFGIALAEAIAAGVPAIGARVGSIPEIVGSTAFTFSSGNVSDAVALIEQLLSQKEQRKKLRDEQYELVKTFSVERMIKSHEQLYKELIK